LPSPQPGAIEPVLRHACQCFLLVSMSWGHKKRAQAVCGFTSLLRPAWLYKGDLRGLLRHAPCSPLVYLRLFTPQLNCQLGSSCPGIPLTPVVSDIMVESCVVYGYKTWQVLNKLKSNQCNYNQACYELRCFKNFIVFTTWSTRKRSPGDILST
jgi:hypothetical protein